MTTVGALAPGELAARLKAGLSIAMPPFSVRLETPLAPLARSISSLYAHYQINEDDPVPDFVIRVAGTGGLRRFYRRQAMAFIDTPPPYVPLPEHMAQMMFEQALNWCVATRTFTHLILHAAVVARNGKAIVIPGESGQGKSTLCASLVARGWRHLSDEFALLDPETLRITAHPRPISLKNQSIAAMKAWAPDAIVSETLEGTPKGNVAYMQPTAHAVAEAGEPVEPVAIVFPGYGHSDEPKFEPISPARAFILMTACSVNYRELGEKGFNAMAGLVDKAPVCSALYPDTESGVALLEQLVAA